MPAPQRNSAHPDVWFAQTIEQQQNRQSLPEDRSFLPSIGLFALPTLLCATLLVVVRPDGALSQANSSGRNLPANPVASRRTEASKRLVVAQNTVTADNGPTVEPPSDGTERLPLSYYTSGIRGSMFGAPLPPAPKPVAPKPVVVKVEPAPKIEPFKVDPFADWAYTGTIRMGEETIALLENTKTKEGQYVKAGDRFLGTEVTAVSDQEVSLGGGTTASRIAKSDSITVTALDKSAPFLSSGGGQPGAPGQPGAVPGQPGMPNMQMPGRGGQIFLPNGNVMQPQDMERMRQQFLDRRFNRGNGGGGFNGGSNGGGGRSAGEFSGEFRGRRNRD